jgi:hypothetical protein
MFSILNPNVVYRDISTDISEHDIDVVSDLWDMDGREVYRGSRDPRFTHATVYWLYDDDLQRVGLVEHSVEDHALFHILWFRDNDYATLFQEDGWDSPGDIWSKLPSHVFEKFLAEGWTQPLSFLEHCLKSDFRIVTPDMITERIPSVHECKKCGILSLKSTSCTTPRVLDFPNRQTTYFVDEDMILYIPPPDSRIWEFINVPPGDAGSSKPVGEPEPQTEPPSPPQAHPQ